MFDVELMHNMDNAWADLKDDYIEVDFNFVWVTDFIKMRQTLYDSAGNEISSRRVRRLIAVAAVEASDVLSSDGGSDGALVTTSSDSD